ncbi:MAG: pilus assembly protein PilM [Desulfuromonadales bacterium]
MLFSKTSAGMEISTTGVKCALVGGTRSAPRVVQVAHAPFPENTLRVSLREQNVLDSELFVERIRAVHNLLLSSSDRVAVTLPDSVGRVLLLDFEGRFKSRVEALDLIRWKLKKSIPFDIEDTHLDYQQLSVRDNGDLAILVALVSRAVISQYEELVVKAGLSPYRIDFNVFNICRCFDRHLSGVDNGILVYLYGSTLGVMAFSDGVPEFMRIKDVSGASALDSRMFRELNSSLLVYREKFPEKNSPSLFSMAAPDVSLAFQEMVAEATGTLPLMLETKTEVTPGNSAPGDQATLFTYTAAIGAALRGLR